VSLAVVAAAIAGGIWATSGIPEPRPNPPGAFSFAALGDAPYDQFEVMQYRRVLRELNAHDLSFVLHIGDIFWRPCTDDHYRTALGRLNGLRHPVIYSPGDNEWTDCWEPRSGGFAPLDRLASLRRIFFADPRQSLGGRRLPLASQADRPPFAEFVENARWSHAGVVFATVHLVGMPNGMKPFPARTGADDEAVRRRTEAAAAWLRETMAEATAANATAAVIGFHGTLGFGPPIETPEREAYEPFILALEEEVERFGKPVLAVHGDYHRYTVDQPLVNRATGRRLVNFTRLEVPGSPAIGWVRVVVTPGAGHPFAFQPLVIPRWKFW
jgi:hypothetical protein